MATSQEGKGVLSNITNTYQNKKDFGTNKIPVGNKFTKGQNLSKERSLASTSAATKEPDCCYTPGHQS